MSSFDWSALRRAPDVEAPELFAHDASDLLLSAHAVAVGVPGERIAVIGDGYGAITLSLAAAGLRGVRVHQDLATGRRALSRNAARVGVDPAAYSEHELDASLLGGVRLVLLQLPKALSELEEIADAVARWAASDVVLVAAGRVKHMTLAMNEVLGQFFEAVHPQRAVRKSRLLVASRPRPVPEQPPFPVLAEHEVPGGRLVLAAHGAVFAGARLDIGTRVLLEALGDAAGPLPGQAEATGVVDLGCGSGALAAWYAREHPTARVIATDRSAAAVQSARVTMAANGLEGRVEVTHDDAGSEIPDASADIVLLNPPFHLGTSVHTGAASRLFSASARVLRPEGELWAVWNSSLRYRAELERTVGPTEQLVRTPKFTVTRSVRHSA